MTPTPLHSTPRLPAVLRAQLRAVGLALRRPALIATSVAALATLLILIEVVRTGEVVGFHPEHQMLPGVVGLLFPIFVWKGDRRFGAGFLWTLPVDRRHQAMAKVFAGWVWLMTALALFMLWLLGLCLFSGGSLLAEETLQVMGALGTQDLRSVPWTPSPLLWLVPFTAATGTYLLASALTLAVRHPLRWIAGSVLALFLVVAVGHAANLRWLILAPQHLLGGILEGPYGLDALLTARTESLKIDTTLSTGESVVVWRALPTLAQWAMATVIWTAAGLLALWAASFRHGERRRA